MKTAMKSGIKIVLLALIGITSFSIIAISQESSKSNGTQNDVPKEGDQYIKLPNPKKVAVTIKKSAETQLIAEDYKLEIKYRGLNDKGQAQVDINYSERNSYDGQRDTSGNNGAIPNPEHYQGLSSSDLLAYANTLYRTHYLCDGKLNQNSGWKNGKAIKELASGYKNFTGTSRFYEQCIQDGSFDAYYDEHLDFGTVPFNVGEIKKAYEFAITVNSATAQEAAIEISYIGKGRYAPTEKATALLVPQYQATAQPVVQLQGNPLNDTTRTGHSSEFDKLRELKKLLDDGVINQKEFEQKKKELLEKI